MVALFESFEDAGLEPFETFVSTPLSDAMVPSHEVDVRLEKVSAARDAIAGSRYEIDEAVLDVTVDAVHLKLAMMQ